MGRQKGNFGWRGRRVERFLSSKGESNPGVAGEGPWLLRGQNAGAEALGGAEALWQGKEGHVEGTHGRDMNLRFLTWLCKKGIIGRFADLKQSSKIKK